MNDLPMANARSAQEIDRIRSLIASRNLAGAANNTKWNELISFIRALDDWRPSYRFKWVSGIISGWDVEWFYHLPFPFAGVEWFDMGLLQQIKRGRLVEPETVDHSQIILQKLAQIGFEFEVKTDVVRIWGYLPKSYEDFPPG